MYKIKEYQSERITGEINNVYLNLNYANGDKIVTLIKKIQDSVFGILQKTFVITAEDIYGDDDFGGEIQEKLNADGHNSIDIFFDAVTCYERNSKTNTNIVELNKVDIEVF